jgi:HK97 family phage major capsid protein
MEAPEPRSTAVVPLRASFPKKAAINPAEHVFRSIVAKVIGHATKADPRQVLIERYGEDGNIDPATKAVFDVVTRSATLPATTTATNWAIELVQTSISSFMQVLMPSSVYPSLSAKGMRLNFGRSGIISIPTRDTSVPIAGAFILQGDPIPVKQGKFTAATLGPKKMAVISTFTREIAEHSTPAIEGLIRDAMQEDTSFALDGVLVGTSAATAAAPAGLRVGAAAGTATAGGGFAALVADMKMMVGALITTSNGNLRSPVWLMNPANALSASLTQNAGGNFPFKQEIASGSFNGYPLIVSSTVPVNTVIFLDAADFVSIEGDSPRFDVSDQALLHMETTPAQISTIGTAVAFPTRSLYQTDTMALRMIMDINWVMRRPTVTWLAAVTW